VTTALARLDDGLSVSRSEATIMGASYRDLCGSSPWSWS